MDELIRGQGIRKYGLFAVTTEGKRLPDGSESASGFVVDDRGQVHSFWLDWDEQQHRIGFTRWKEITPGPDWEEDEEYQAACKTAGLR